MNNNDYSRAPSLGADQKTRGLWERDWTDPPFLLLTWWVERRVVVVVITRCLT